MTTKFPIPDDAFNALVSAGQKLPDTRRYVFDAPLDRDFRGARNKFVLVSRPISRRAAKHDKVAIRYAKTHGVEFRLAPEQAFKNAGLRHDTWQWREA